MSSRRSSGWWACPATRSRARPARTGPAPPSWSSGRPLAEPWQTSRTDPFPAVAVPAGEVFVLGDARPESADSRLWGTVPLTGLRGVAVARLSADGSPLPVPGAPGRELPDDLRYDPAGPVPPASAG